MQVDLWDSVSGGFITAFSKATNSTKQADLSDFHKAVTGEIKGDFSPLNPVIRFSNDAFSLANMPSYNYGYIRAFKRYYFISWAYVDGCWEASCKVDVLASFKTEILASRQYVARSAIQRDINIVDGLYTTKCGFSYAVDSKSQAEIFGTGYNTGVYVVGIVGYTSTMSEYGSETIPANVGALTYYAMNSQAFYGLMFALLSNVNWMNIDVTELSQDLQKALINPTQYIKSCMWLPIPAANYINTPQRDVTQTVRFGWWDFNLGVNVRKLAAPLSEATSRKVSFKLSAVQHPRTLELGTWTNLSPYTRRELTLPFFGNFDLDTTKITGPEIMIDYYFHPFTGDAVCYVWNTRINGTTTEKTNLIMSAHGRIGVEIPIGQIAFNTGNMRNALLAGAAAGVSELATIVGGEK